MPIGIVAGYEMHEVQNFAKRLARLVAGQDQVGDRDGAGIDERIARDALLEFELDDGIEGAAGGFAPDPGPQFIAIAAERDREREHFRDALDRERHVAFAAAGDLAVGVDHGKPELVGIDAGKFGDIGRDLAAVGAVAHFGADFGDGGLQVGHAA